MEERNPNINWSKKIVFLLSLAGCLLLAAVGLCVKYAWQNQNLTAANESISVTLVDKEQIINTQAVKTEMLRTQLAESASMEESETESGFSKKNGIYLIDTQNQLWTLQRMIAENVEIEPGMPAASASYRLRNDIDFHLNDNPLPLFYLGTEDAPFCGTFDGDDHSISGYFPLTDDDMPEALFHTDPSAQIENLLVFNSITSNIPHNGFYAGLSEPWQVSELERHLADCPDYSIKVEIDNWDLDVDQTAAELRSHWEKLLAQEEPRDCYVSLTFCPRDEDFEVPTPGTLARDERTHGAYIQSLHDALITLAGEEYTTLIEETLAQEEGYLWFLRLERIGGLTCCTFETGRPESFPDSDDDSFYLIVDGEWDGKTVKRQCFPIPYTIAVWSSIGIGSYNIESVDFNFDGKEDLLIHVGSSGGSGGLWDNYRALVWKPDDGQFAFFPSFPEQVSGLDFNRRRVIFHKSEGWAEEHIDVYEIVNGEYVRTKELLAEDIYLNWEHVTRLSLYEMGELVETHILSDINEREVLYPDLASYWFKG